MAFQAMTSDSSAIGMHRLVSAGAVVQCSPTSTKEVLLISGSGLAHGSRKIAAASVAVDTLKKNIKPPADLQEQFAHEFVQQTPGPVLVVGSAIYAGRLNWRLRHPQGIGVDMLEGDGVDVVQNLEHAPLSAKFAHIEVLSVLEHTQRPWKVAENLESMLMEGGSIFVSVPWVWRNHSYPHDYWRFSHKALPILFPSIDWKVIRYGVLGELVVSERSPKTESGHLPKMELLAFGVKS